MMQEGTSGEKQKGGSQYVWVTSLGKKTSPGESVTVPSGCP